MNSHSAFYKFEYGFLKITCTATSVIGIIKTDALDAENIHSDISDMAYAQIREYLDGERKAFTFPIEFIGTDFQKKVWNALCEIPYGATRTYAQIAEAIGNPNASRAVGMANSKNPLWIVVPCHRVIGANGGLTGYAGGIEMKAFLLSLEANDANNERKERKKASFTIIADDLTGANACGAVLVKEGLDISLVLHASSGLEFREAVIFSTDSRAIPAKEAYERVYNAAKSLGAHHYAKRVDSTLRGNVGAELAAIFDVVFEEYGQEPLCVITPAFPQAGRMVSGGKLYVNQKPLHKTEAAVDPLYPMKSSYITEIVKNSCLPERPIHIIHIETSDIRGGRLTQKFQMAYENGTRFISVDAQDDSDLDMIARAVFDSGILTITADPGPLTGRVARLLSENNARHKILLSIGSVFETTAVQIEKLREVMSFAHAELDVAKLVQKSERPAEIKRAAALLTGAGERLLLLTLSSLHPKHRLDFDEVSRKEGIPLNELPLLITDAVAEVTRRVIGKINVAGVFTSGGDVAVSVCKCLNASGIKLADEIIPLASFGFLEGGIADGLAIATKGGFVGGEDALIECVRYLLKITDILQRAGKK